MNSDKFDRIVLDLLYEELDELTTAAAKRHMEQSARAREIFAHLKATRKLSVLPVHEPPPNFELSVMDGVRRTLAELPVHHRLGRIVSMLAGYAMRPQLIMGALLLLMIGSSLILVRVRPGQHSAIQVTERGAPEADVDLVLPLTARSAPDLTPRNTERDPPSGAVERNMGAFITAEAAANPAPPSSDTAKKPALGGAAGGDAGADGLDPFDQAVFAYRAGHYTDAQRRFERISRLGGARAAEAALYAAQATRNVSGCATAVSRFERVRLRFPGSGSAYEAAWRAAKCLQQLGDLEAARQGYESLLQVATYAEQARQALSALGDSELPAARAAALQLVPEEPSGASLADALDAPEAVPPPAPAEAEKAPATDRPAAAPEEPSAGIARGSMPEPATPGDAGAP